MLRPNKLAAVLNEPLASEHLEGASAVLLVTSDGSVLSSSACSQQASQIPTHCSLEEVFRTGNGNDAASNSATPSQPRSTSSATNHQGPGTASRAPSTPNDVNRSTSTLLKERQQHDIIRQQEVQSRTRVFASFAASAWNIYSKSCQRAASIAPDMLGSAGPTSTSAGELHQPVPGATGQSADQNGGDASQQPSSSSSSPSVEWLTIKTQDLTFLITPLLQRNGSNQVLLVVVGLTTCPLGILRIRAEVLAKVLAKELKGFTLI